MIWLSLCVLCSVAIFVLFRIFPKYNVHTLPAIVINYAVAISFGMLMLPTEYKVLDQLDEPWMRGGLILGTLFISLFYLMAYTAQRSGVGITSIAVKMSLVIPALWFLISDAAGQFPALKIVAFIIAVAGVILSTKQDKEGLNIKDLLIPLVIFIGSGIIDLVIGYFSNPDYLKGEPDKILFTCLPFMTSVFFGSIIVLTQALRGKAVLNFTTIIGGILLGLVNYGSIYFLVKSFNAEIMDRSAIIPVNNLGVVLLSAVTAILLFKEVYSKRNYLGLALALLSIVLLIWSS